MYNQATIILRNDLSQASVKIVVNTTEPVTDAEELYNLCDQAMELIGCDKSKIKSVEMTKMSSN